MERWNVLLVDDEEEFITTLSERLNLRGIKARMAFGGEEAVRQIETDPPDVMVLDVMMPGLGGLGVLDYVKRNYPQVQVILLTGQASTRNGIEGMRLGAFDYLMKPLNIDELIDKMRKAFEERGQSER
jgi:DNA-binding NtrC family response regulator